jgi:RimJ/RimL family protein N-acetyltransferase
MRPPDPGIEPVPCARFQLALFSVPFMQAVLARDLTTAARELDVRLPEGDAWLEETDFLLKIRLEQIEAAPSTHEWLARGIVLPERVLAGHIGFHGAPDGEGVVELGYTVFGPWRRRGYALEAARCLMDWARATHGVRRFRVSIAPDNAPSLAMAARLGFARTGEQMDEIDGLEYVFEMTVD